MLDLTGYNLDVLDAELRYRHRVDRSGAPSARSGRPLRLWSHRPRKNR